MNLTTGRVMTRHHITEVPITEEVIKRVHELADRDQQTEGVSVVHGDGTGVGIDDDSINFDSDESDNEGSNMLTRMTLSSPGTPVSTTTYK